MLRTTLPIPLSFLRLMPCRSLHTSPLALATTEVPSKPRSARKSPPSVISGQFKTYKPVTPSIRHLKRPVSPHLFEGGPLRALTIPKRKTGGRNKAGHITTRSLGGGHKQRIRVVDFHRMQGGKQDVVRIEYDPGRSAHIALIKSRDPNAKQVWSYILAPDALRAGDVVQSFRDGIPDGLVPGYVDQRGRKRKGEKLAEGLGMKREDGRTTALPEQLGSLDPQVTDMQSTTETDMPPPESFDYTTGEYSNGAPDPLDPSTPQTVAPPQPAQSSPFPFTPFEEPPPSQGPAISSTAQLSLGILRTLTVKPGNVLPLRLIPTGVHIHNISLKPYGPGILVRSAGSFGEVVAHDEDGKYSQVRLQSGEVRRVGQECVATVGKVSNPNWKLRQLGKAGRTRNLGRRPHVRGMAMNAVDHPHGGGRGKSKGNKAPRSIWGLINHTRTRKPGPYGHKGSNKFVVKERPRGHARRS